MQAEVICLTLCLNHLLGSSTLWPQRTWCLWLPFPSGSNWERTGCISVRVGVCQLSLDQFPSTLPADQSSLPAWQEMLQLEILLIKQKISNTNTRKDKHSHQAPADSFPASCCSRREREIMHTQGMRAKTDYALSRRCSVLHHFPGSAGKTRELCWCGCLQRIAVDYKA